MALRSLDNALPKSPERCKKPSKFGASIQKQSDPAVNDENKATFPQDATIDYIFSENLEPISDPETWILSLPEGLESNDWVRVCEALNSVRRFALYQSTLLLPLLEKVISVVVKSMKSPRSALCKTSIMASSDLFTAYRDGLLESSMSGAFDQLVLQLLLKACQDKRFVCDEAEKALKTMVGSMTPLSLLCRLRTFVSHSNPRVRAKAAVSMSQCVSKMGWEGMKEHGVPALLQIAAELLSDRLPEARDAGRSIVVSVCGGFAGNGEHNEDSWQDFCHCNLPPVHAQPIVKMTASHCSGD